MTSAFFLGVILAIFGSFLPGLINMSVVTKAINRGMRAAFKMTIGAGIVEFVQGFIGLRFGGWLNNHENWQLGIQWIAIAVFITMGLYQLFFADKRQRRRELRIKMDDDYKTTHPTIKGMGVTALNVLAFPYWMFFGSWTISQGWLKNEIPNVLVFCCGIFIGAVIIFTTYAKLGQWIVRRLDFIRHYMNRAIGYLFLGLGIWQLILIITNA